ncbi:MAG: acyl-CoA dehydratase activase [Desulfobacteraceae bacterium]
MITAGVDCGSRNIKSVIIEGGRIIGKACSPAGPDQAVAVEAGLSKALYQAGVGLKELAGIGATGSGRDFAGVACAKVDEVEAMRLGAGFYFPGARTVVDVGAEEGRAAKLDHEGRIADFVVNERCAAAAGAFIDTMSRVLDAPIEHMGPLALESDKQVPMSAECVVFAESEVEELIYARTEKRDIIRAVYESMAGRIASLIRRIGINREVVMVGGAARDPALLAALKRELELEKIHVPEGPEYASALGAALAAAGEGAGSHARRTPGEPRIRGVWDTAVERNPECRAWPESNWGTPESAWRDAAYITVGIDVGSVGSQAVVMADGEIAAYGSRRNGPNRDESSGEALDLALKALGDRLEDRIDYVVGTGYGRVNMPMADRTLTEIACQARGAVHLFGPGVRTVLDVGGQDIKVIRCDERGKVVDFLMNDKCAAGTGRGMEVFAELLGVPIQEVGERSFQVGGEPEAVYGTCVVFAELEALALLRSGWSVEEVLAAYCRFTAEQIFSVVDKSGPVPGLGITGGMAKNRGVMDRLVPMMGLEAMETEWDPQIAGAAGAALFGYALCVRGKGRRKK